jgi:1-acyl-sn-glycerol-3-phosphate acyltransferase
VGWLALASGAPVIPVGVTGTDKIQPVGRVLPRLGKITVRFGKPLWFSAGGENPAKARRAATDEIMAEIQRLSGQEDAGEFNQLSG